jgi:RNA polymerase sigma-70 factor (ECF subfamily)
MLRGYFLSALGSQGPDFQQAANLTDESDARLAGAVLRKDRKATAEFVSRFADGVYAYVHSRLLPRRDLVDDLVQEVFLAAWENLQQYRGTSPLQAWLMGIARHKVEDHYRARLRAPGAIDDLDGDSDVLASSPDFESLLEQEQVRKNTWRVMSGLPEQYRLALIWRYWEKASARDMAAKTGKTEKAIERLLARARAEFRERWNHG